MYRIICFMLLAIVSNSTVAEWIEIHSNTSGNVTNHIDSTTIRTEGDMIKFWILSEFKTASSLNGISVMSIKAQNQIDCKEELSRVIYSSFYPERKAGGKPVYTISEPQKWIPIPPDNLFRSLFEAFCNKK